MIYKCENCQNRFDCPEKQTGYIRLCIDAEALNKMHYPNAYYTLTVKCDYWVEDKETYNDIGEVEGCVSKEEAEAKLKEGAKDV